MYIRVFRLGIKCKVLSLRSLVTENQAPSQITPSPQITPLYGTCATSDTRRDKHYDTQYNTNLKIVIYKIGGGVRW